MTEKNESFHIDHYRILDTLGEGAMGVVYLAQDINHSADPPVALKKIRKDSAVALSRFQEEGNVLQDIDHPHVVKFHRYTVTREGGYIVTERLEGVTLDELLEHWLEKGVDGDLGNQRNGMNGSDRNGQQGSGDGDNDGRSALVKPNGLPAKLVLDIACQCSSALTKTHRAHIAHRDLKPQNIMTTEPAEIILKQGQVTVKILDFGIALRDARLRGKLTQTGAFIGTPLYSAPEQLLQLEQSANATELDAEGHAQPKNPEDAMPADIFALGSILYQLWTGQPLFDPEDSRLRGGGFAVLAKLREVLSESVEALRASPPKAISDSGAELLLAEMLALQPKDRPTAEALEQRFDAMRRQHAARLEPAESNASSALAESVGGTWSDEDFSSEPSRDLASSGAQAEAGAESVGGTDQDFSLGAEQKSSSEPSRDHPRDASPVSVLPQASDARPSVLPQASDARPSVLPQASDARPSVLPRISGAWPIKSPPSNVGTTHSGFGRALSLAAVVAIGIVGLILWLRPESEVDGDQPDKNTMAVRSPGRKAEVAPLPVQDPENATGGQASTRSGEDTDTRGSSKSGNEAATQGPIESKNATAARGSAGSGKESATQSSVSTPDDSEKHGSGKTNTTGETRDTRAEKKADSRGSESSSKGPESNARKEHQRAGNPDPAKTPLPVPSPVAVSSISPDDAFRARRGKLPWPVQMERIDASNSSTTKKLWKLVANQELNVFSVADGRIETVDRDARRSDGAALGTCIDLRYGDSFSMFVCGEGMESTRGAGSRIRTGVAVARVPAGGTIKLFLRSKKTDGSYDLLLPDQWFVAVR